MVFGKTQKPFCPSITATKIWFFEKAKTKPVLVYTQVQKWEILFYTVILKEKGGFKS
jgi:hypothetical protein